MYCCDGSCNLGDVDCPGTSSGDDALFAGLAVLVTFARTALV